MQPRDKAQVTFKELELCFGGSDCGDGVTETLRLAFEFEVDYREALCQLQDPPDDA